MLDGVQESAENDHPLNKHMFIVKHIVQVALAFEKVEE